MTKEEAFRQWINSTQGKGLTYQEMWNAACEWQKDKDAALIKATASYSSSPKAIYYLSAGAREEMAKELLK